VFALIGHHVLLGNCAIRLDFAGMAEQIDRLDALVRRYRWRQAEGTIEMHRGLLAHLTGRLDEAEGYYAKGGDLLRASGAIDADGIELLAFLSVRITQGRVAELWDQLAGVISADDVMADLIAFPLTATGRWEQAREARRSIRPVRRDFFHAFLLTLRGMIVATLQDPVEAASVYPELLPYAGQIAGVGTGSYAAGPVDSALGDLALLLGRADDAKAHYTVALRLSRRCGNDYWSEQASGRLAAV
jgi:tetratricopeptide (TPR) repeat protein